MYERLHANLCAHNHSHLHHSFPQPIPNSMPHMVCTSTDIQKRRYRIRHHETYSISNALVNNQNHQFIKFKLQCQSHQLPNNNPPHPEQDRTSDTLTFLNVKPSNQPRGQCRHASNLFQRCQTPFHQNHGCSVSRRGNKLFSLPLTHNHTSCQSRRKTNYLVGTNLQRCVPTEWCNP